MHSFLRALMALAYIAAGINHFWHPAPYEAIMPPWLPAPHFLVALSGVFEIILGAGILYRPTRRASAWGLILLLVAIFPANIQMTINYHQQHHPHFAGALLRLPLQVLLIWWAWVYTKKEEGQRA